MHKLRSMTETIKMLSKENEILRGENNDLARLSKSDTNGDSNDLKSGGVYGDLSRNDLISLTMSYDEKVKALTEEVCALQKEIHQQRLLTATEVEAATQTMKSSGEKDKYKALARRLKEERNQYRETCEEKQKEQSALKDEMEKMSELISELRENCQKLQSELLEVRQLSREHRSIGIQVSLLAETNSRPLPRKMSTTSSSIITQEAMKRAKSVYGPKQPKPRLPGPIRNQQATNSSSSSSIISLKDADEVPTRKRTTIPTRSAATSPAKPIPTSAKSSPQPRRQAGPTIARPVTKPSLSQPQSPLLRPGSHTPSPARTPNSNRIPVSSTISSSRVEFSSVSSLSTPSRILSPSRIPSPKNRPNRIPSAPRYKPPVRAQEPPPAPSPSPPPPPPPTVSLHEHCAPEQSMTSSPRKSFSRESTPNKYSYSRESTPRFTSPPPAPPQSRACLSASRAEIEVRLVEEEDEDDDDDEDEEILCVHADGQVEMHSTSRASNRSNPAAGSPSIKSPYEEPIVPNVIPKSPRSPLDVLSDEDKTKVEQVSADDEGSRDGEDGVNVDHQSSPVVACTPRTKKKVDHLKQGLAARRIQRTWKHFYQELEERKESSQNSTLNPNDENNSAKEDILSNEEKKENISNHNSPKRVDAFSPKTDTFSSSPKIEDKNKQVDPDESAVRYIQAVMEAHETRTKTLTGLRSKFHIARPWQKSIENESAKSSNRITNESSEEEMEQVCRTIHSVLQGHDTRQTVLRRLEEDRDLFTTGKVSRMRAAINARRSDQTNAGRFHERSDGITDDDEDLAY